MSLMIKDAKMPSNCKECEYKFCIDCVKYIGFHHKNEARANNCPIREVTDNVEGKGVIDISNDLATVLFYLAECVRYTGKTMQQPDCLTCGKLKGCEYRPSWGDDTRINCPLWVKEAKGDAE